MIELTDEQTTMLNAPLDPGAIKYKQGRPYIAGSTIIENANRIFGAGRWRIDVIEPYYIEQWTDDPNAPRLYCQRVHLYINDLIVADEVGTGIAYMHNAARIPDELDSAIKGARTDAMKRCFRVFGAQFGSTLVDLAYQQAQGQQGNAPPQGQQGNAPPQGQQYAPPDAQGQQGGTPCIDCGKGKPNTYPRCYDCNQAFKAARNTPPNAPPPNAPQPNTPPNAPPNAPQQQYAYADDLGQYTPDGEYMPPAQGYGAAGYYEAPAGSSPFAGAG